MLRIAMLGVYADQALGSTFRRIYAPFLRIPHYDATSDIWQLPARNTTSLQPDEAERIGSCPSAPMRLRLSRASNVKPARVATAALRSLRASHQISTRSASRTSKANCAIRRVASVAKP